MPSRNVPAKLPMWEQAIYWIAECCTISYMLYSVYQASQKCLRENEPMHFEEGWTWIGGPKDGADFEWGFWSSFFWEVLPWLCGQVVLSCALTWSESSVNIKAIVCVLYSTLALTRILGFYTVLCLIVHSLVLFLVSKLGSAKMVWLTTLSFLTILNMTETVEAIVHSLHKDFEIKFYLCVYVWANLCQRATAFALECVWVQQSHRPAVMVDSVEEVKRNSETAPDSACWKTLVSKPVSWPTLAEAPTWLDMFYYMFYLPLFFTGPLMVYYNFHRQARQPQPLTGKRLKNVVLQLVRIIFWAIVYFLIQHLVYVHSINNRSLTLAKQSRWTLAAIGYLLGQFFMMKYVVLFGLPAQLARLDGFEPPAVPACISYIYCYSDMWKSFDRGLYDFVKRYIFIPCGGSQEGLGLKVMGSVMCFGYIFYWHGAERSLFLWCIINFVEISLEQVGAWLETTSVIKKYFYNKLTCVGIRRVRAIMSVPVFLMSVFAIFYFFGGTRSGVVFLTKLLIDIPWSSFGVFYLLVYCAVQNAMEIERLGLAKLKVGLSLHRD